MAYVLIWWMSIYSGGAGGSAEFTTKERCEAAGKAFLESEKYRGQNGKVAIAANYVCVQK
jgi:hypothetical protein